MSIERLKKDLDTMTEERNRVHGMWLEVQKENVRRKEEMKQILGQNSNIQTQMSVRDIMKEKDVKLLEEAKKEAVESKLQTSHYKAQVKKLNEKIEEIQDENVTFLIKTDI
jgi:hypothetical protein